MLEGNRGKNIRDKVNKRRESVRESACAFER